MSSEAPTVRNPESVLVCFAVKEEAAPFRKIAASKPGVSILITGIGRQNTRRSLVDQLARSTPGLVLTCGFAGGLDPALKIGDVIFEPSDSPRAEALTRAGAKPAKFFCAARIASTAAEKKKLRDDTHADAVEMESAEIHSVCRERGIPCVTVRVISDTALDDMPLDFNQLSKPDLSLDFGKLAWAIAKSPGKIGALLKLQKETRFAAEKLADVLRAVASVSLSP
jgi:adenosylhomocysteine nucleosidase